MPPAREELGVRWETIAGFFLMLGVVGVLLFALFENDPSEAGGVKKFTTTQRLLNSFTIDGSGNSVLVNDTTFVQMHMGLSTVDNDSNLALPNGGPANASRDVICNPTGVTIDNLELSFTGAVVRISLGAPQLYQISVGTCLDCIADDFPQLVDGDEMALQSMIEISLSNFSGSLPLSFSGTGTAAPNQCFGFMAKALTAGGSGSALALSLGRANLHFTR